MLFRIHRDAFEKADCLRQNLVFAKIAMQIDALRNQGLAFSHAAFRRAQEPAGGARTSTGVVEESADRGDKQESGQPNPASRVFKLMPQQTRMLTSTI
ncbi:hypothetical protein [Collimonas sp. PA-H2]|uniref:hypothetical protein n=1 Tax=Collimonas sp. PA-H2 TaxID=1881062 RepID=UPI00117BECD6|nr:hypothetical protein [Collimonas sp. PA-H2]